MLGASAYYRVYAERQLLKLPQSELEKLLTTGIVEYCPIFHWSTVLPVEVFISYFVDILLWPKGNEIFAFLRLAILLGTEFSSWVMQLLKKKWGHYSQPPRFYYSFMDQLPGRDDRITLLLAAAKLSKQAQIAIGGRDPITVEKLVDDPSLAQSELSRACLQVFSSGDSEARSASRTLDVLSYGQFIAVNRDPLIQAIKEQMGDRLPRQDG